VTNTALKTGYQSQSQAQTVFEDLKLTEALSGELGAVRG